MKNLHVHFVTTHNHVGEGITIISIIGNEQHEVKITYLLKKIAFGGKLQIIFIARVIQTMNQEFVQLIKNQSSRIRKKYAIKPIQSNDNSTHGKRASFNIEIKFRSIKTWQSLSETMCHHQAFQKI